MLRLLPLTQPPATMKWMAIQVVHVWVIGWVSSTCACPTNRYVLFAHPPSPFACATFVRDLSIACVITVAAGEDEDDDEDQDEGANLEDVKADAPPAGVMQIDTPIVDLPATLTAIGLRALTLTHQSRLTATSIHQHIEVQQLVTQLIQTVKIEVPVFRDDVDVTALFHTHLGGPFKSKAQATAATKKMDQVLTASILRRERQVLSVENFGSMAYGLGTINSVLVLVSLFFSSVYFSHKESV
jgi:hypothetical protein